MQITFSPSALSAELYKLLGVTNSKGPLAVVSNALLTATADDTLTLEATDLEISVATTMPCQVKRPGQLCLNAHNLHSVVKGLSADQADLSAQDNHWAQLTCGGVDCRIVGVPAAEFPRLPTLTDLKPLPIETKTLVSAIERTLFSISTDEGRPNLMGAHFSIKGGQLLMVSTDGHRLSKVNREVATSVPVPEALAEGVIIPKKSLVELKRTVDQNEPEVRLAVTGNSAVFQWGRTTLMVRLVDATFPDFQRVVPAEIAERQARLNRDEFIQKIKFVSLFTNPRTSNITLSFNGDLLELSASDPETGEGRETMPIRYTGAKVQAGFNYRYLLDVLSVLKEPEARFQVVDAFSATLLLDGDRADDLFLIMPMRL